MPQDSPLRQVRVRFAPSPTGYVHVGNARTALFNWLFARHRGGAFVLRIEDTDVERSDPRYEEQLLRDLRWFGLDWDEGPDKVTGDREQGTEGTGDREQGKRGKSATPPLSSVTSSCGPYRQSERKEIYAKFAQHLIADGHAYYCFCTADQLEAERQEAMKVGRQPKYSGRCRAIVPQEASRRVASGEPVAIRLKIAEGVYAWRDLVHGETSFSSDVMGDPILVRSDGHPAYNYAVVIDDHLMTITHVIRGDDHISNTPRQLALYRAFGWAPPEFAHLSTILGPDRSRLSKRHGATSLESFREMGILPEALRNYLALLGWSPADGKTEILSTEELIAQFSLEHITKSPAVFDQEKLNWLNRHYMKQLPWRRLAELSAPFLAKEGYLPGAEPVAPAVLAWIERVLDAVLKNLDTLGQAPGAARVIFEYDAAKIAQQQETSQAIEDAGGRAVLSAFIPKALAESTLTYDRFRQITREVQKETGKKGRELFHPIRVALTGAVSGPELEKLIPIFEDGAKLPLPRRVKSCAERLRELQAAKL